jgi:tetratricopeptide (TPR) repeat protein
LSRPGSQRQTIQLSTRLDGGVTPAPVQRDTDALLDPATNKRSEPNNPVPFHLVGERLLRVATVSGRPEAAAAAAEVFREGIKAVPADPSLHNSSGAAILAMARFASHADALNLLAEATKEFQAALGKAEGQRAPRAARLRYAVNLATVLWLRGERSGDQALVEEAVEKLRSLVTELSESSPYWVHVQDNLGNALAALRHYTEAIDAFEAALRGHQTDLERARSLNNIGTAHAGRHRYGEACKYYRGSLLLLSAEQTPLAWGLAQHNLATAMLQSALASRHREGKIPKLQASAKAFRSALGVRQRNRTPVDWAVTTANMAGALLSLGAHLCTATSLSDRQSGLRQVREAIDLFHQSLPDLAGSDLEKTGRNLLVALQILGDLAGDSRIQQEIHARRVQLLLFARDHGLTAIVDEIGNIPVNPTQPRPRLPVGLDWPTETYAGAHKERGENVVQFLSRVWLPLIRAGVVDLRTLRLRDPSAAKAIDNFRQRRDPATGLRRTLPRELDIPTKRELNDRLAAAITEAGDRPARLDWALRSRARRQRV